MTPVIRWKWAEAEPNIKNVELNSQTGLNHK